ncbi:MAG: S1C family serine protease [Ignavibacteriaceae bacterium]
MKRAFIFFAIYSFNLINLPSLYAQDSWDLLFRLAEKRNEINRQTKEIIETTIDYLSQLDVYPYSKAEDEINYMLNNYKDYCRRLYTNENVTSIPGAEQVNELIFKESKEVLKSDKYLFFAEMKERKKEMDRILSSLELNDKQIEKAKESYTNFLSDPLKKRKDGSYEGFFFNPKDITKYGPKSGTGFLISNDGIVVTNNHVVENADKILLKCFLDNSTKTYEASLLLSDPKNDLALLKLSDNSFAKTKIPFLLKDASAEVGEDIFVLGYPLTTTMGEELKVTTGIVSSRTGFQGDVTSYQISAPVQPGNSGGPLLNNSGDVIGIVSAKHTDTENVTYAIKSNYLKLLIETIEPKVNLPTKNTYSKKNLVDKIKILRDLIFIIETE